MAVVTGLHEDEPRDVPVLSERSETSQPNTGRQTRQSSAAEIAWKGNSVLVGQDADGALGGLQPGLRAEGAP
jgi:hypothetical protein